MRRREVLALGLAALSVPASTLRAARAQAKYPERPIRLVIPFTPGGVNNAIGRPWANKMKSLLGTVTVENIGGAGGSLGAAAVARSQPDGYTILLGGAGSHVINPVASRPPYDPIKDFEPISMLATTGLAIAVHPALPVSTLKELIDYAKTNPGKLSYGSSGVGAMTHLTGELFKSLIGAPDIVHVPYRGGGSLISDLVSGQIPMIAQSVTGHVIELHQAGKVRMLAVTSPAVSSPCRRSRPRSKPGCRAWSRRISSACSRPPERQRRSSRGSPRRPMTPWPTASSSRAISCPGSSRSSISSPEQARRFVEGEIARWTPVIKAIGLKLD